jgi:hypothetical protein
LRFPRGRDDISLVDCKAVTFRDKFAGSSAQIKHAALGIDQKEGVRKALQMAGERGELAPKKAQFPVQ